MAYGRFRPLGRILTCSAVGQPPAAVETGKGAGADSIDMSKAPGDEPGSLLAVEISVHSCVGGNPAFWPRVPACAGTNGA